MTMIMMRNESDAESKESDNEIRARSVSLEQGYVHEVYDHIANDLLFVSDEHRSPVQEFLEGLEIGSLVADVGCGDGRYLSIQESVFTLGLDRCPKMLKEAKATRNQCDVMEGDNLNLPYRDATMDAVISVAVVHHFATRERRILALRELARILRIGGKLLIIVQGDHLKCESSDVLIPWYQNPKRKHSSNTVQDSSLEVNYDSNEEISGVNDGDDDDDDDVSVPSSDEEDALVPDEHWIYSSRAHQFLQNDKQATSATPTNITKNESLLQTSTSVESCYGFVRNVLRRFSSQPTPSILPTEEFPYTIASKAKDRFNNSEPTSPVMNTLASETTFQSSSLTRTIESMIKNDIIELRNVDDPLKTKLDQSCGGQQFATTVQDATSPTVSENGKELARSLNGFFKKFPTFWSKRNSLPVDSSKSHDHVSHQLKHRSLILDSDSNHAPKLIRSKTTATCTLHLEPYSPLESVDEDSRSDGENDYYDDRQAISHRNRARKQSEERFNTIEFTKDDIVNGNMEPEVDSFYLYTDGNYVSKHQGPNFNQSQNGKNCENESLNYSDIQQDSHPMNVHSRKGDLRHQRSSETPKHNSNLSQQNPNYWDEYIVSSGRRKKKKLSDTQGQIEQTFFNSFLYQTNDCLVANREYIDDDYDDDDLPIDVNDTPISNKRTMNDDIEEVYGHLKTLRFDEWSGSPKRYKRSSYPNYQMVSSKTLGPFYDSDEEIEDHEVVLSSYYSMPELYKLADYYQEYIFSSRNCSRVKQTEDISTTTSNATIMKDSLGNFILDEVHESKMINFERGKIDIKEWNGNSFHRTFSHRKLSDLVETQEENATMSESENDVKSLDEVPSTDSQIVPQNDTSPKDVIYRKNDKVQDFKRRHSLLQSLGNSNCVNTNVETHTINSIALDCEKCASYLLSDDSYLENSSDIIPSGVGENNYTGSHKMNSAHANELILPELPIDDRDCISQNLTTKFRRLDKNVANSSYSSAFSKLVHGFDDVELCSYSQQNMKTSEGNNCLSREGKLASRHVSFEHSNIDLPLAKNKRNLFEPPNEESVRKTQELNAQCKNQSELITVDELFSFDDVYSDLKGTNELDLITMSAFRSHDDCLKNCEVTEEANADLLNEGQDSLSILDASGFCVENLEGLNAFNELKTYSKCVSEITSDLSESHLTNTDTKVFSKTEGEIQNQIHVTEAEKSFTASEQLQNGNTSAIVCSTKTNCFASHADVPNHSLQTAGHEDCAYSPVKQSSQKNTDNATPMNSLHGYISDPCATLDTHRYFHLFQEHELELLIEEHVEDLHVLHSFQHQFSRCVIAEKVQVWTI